MGGEKDGLEIPTFNHCNTQTLQCILLGRDVSEALQHCSGHCSNMDIVTSYSGYISFGYILYPGTAASTAVAGTM
eukprot:scaffold22868_cov23-Cyclotella_meneghiniana.AAC.2